MTIAILQQTVTADDNDVTTLTCAIAPTGTSSELVCFISANEYLNANFATGVTDSAGNTWTRIASVQTSGVTSTAGDVSLEVWHSSNANPTNQVTATYAASMKSVTIMVMEWTGVLGFDTVTTFTTPATATTITPSTTPVKYGDVFLFCAASGSTAQPLSHVNDSMTEISATGFKYVGNDLAGTSMSLAGYLTAGAGVATQSTSFATAAGFKKAGIALSLNTQTSSLVVGTGPPGLTSSWQLMYRGLTVGGAGSYGLKNVAGLRDTPALRSTDDPRSLQDGTFLAPDYMNGRTISADLIISGTSDADLASKVQLLENTFVPNTGSTVEYPLYWQLPSGYQRRAFGRLRRRSTPTDLMYQLHAAACAVEFYCSDPLTYDSFDTTVTIAPAAGVTGRTYPRVFPFSYGSGSNSSTINAVNGGNVPTYPLITFYGPSFNPYIINNTTGSFLWFNLTLNQGDVFLIDTRNQTALVNGSSVRGNLIQGSTWMTLQPGLNNLQFTPGSGSGQCQVTFRSAWL
jgi:tail protein